MQWCKAQMPTIIKLMDDDEVTLNKVVVELLTQDPDFADQNVYDLVKLDDSKYWEEPISTPIRFDVHDGSCSWFQWKVSTTTDLTIVGYAIDYTVSGTRIIAGKKLS